MAKVLKGGKIVTATDIYEADIRIQDEKIIAIGKEIELEGDEIVPVYGCYLFPGAIDTHTHFDLDVGSTVTADDFESGTKAAMMGGTTTILDFATQNKGETLKQALSNWRKKSDGKCYSDYGFHMAITDWNDNTSKEMEDMIKEGISSFKMYMAYKDTLQVDDSTIFRALRRSNEVGALIGFHCENGDVIDFLINEEKSKGNYRPFYHPLTRPALLEKEAVSKLMSLVELADSQAYVVHLSSKEALEAIIEAKKRGINIYVETCPQYLLLNDKYYGEKDSESFEGAKYVMSPPLRKVEDNEVLWNALERGLIDTIGTDHCSFNYRGQKELGLKDFSRIPNGAPGVEHRLLLIYTYGVLTGKISLNDMIALISTNAAKIFGLYPRKGTIAVGSDGDIVVFNPEGEHFISHKYQTQNVDYTPYEGFKYKGCIEHVFLRGNHVVKNSTISTDKALGKYIPRTPLMKEVSI